MWNQLYKRLTRPVSIAPLVVFRIIFGGMMLGGTIRFWLNGWIDKLYLQPTFFFKYHGFEWVEGLGNPGMYILFLIIGLSALFIMLGFFYRLSAIVFFLSFTYCELIDVTTYLNHYYFISIVAFLMIFLPANRSFSVDTYLRPSLHRSRVPFWTIGAIMGQLSIVYFFAGVAKLNADWLLEAQPLTVWLKPKYETPLIGWLFEYSWVPFFFSWFGAIYDLTIPFFLWNKRTVRYAYLFVVAFHVLTAALFPIGMFPYIMILSTLIFFPSTLHEKIIRTLRRLFKSRNTRPTGYYRPMSAWYSKVMIGFLGIHFLIQILLPWRHMAYPGDLFWNEQGFRFSWRVMLMEKYGTADFYLKDPRYPGYKPVMDNRHLTPGQEKFMASQPDLILQYADYLKEYYDGMTFIDGKDTITIQDPEIHADIYVTLNGRSHMKYVSKGIDLTSLEDGFYDRSWLEPYIAEK